MKKAAPSVKDEKELPSRGTWQKYSRPGIQNMQTLRECFPQVWYGAKRVLPQV